jgi:hypothetical protein
MKSTAPPATIVLFSRLQNLRCTIGFMIAASSVSMMFVSRRFVSRRCYADLFRTDVTQICFADVTQICFADVTQICFAQMLRRFVSRRCYAEFFHTDVTQICFADVTQNITWERY